MEQAFLTRTGHGYGAGSNSSVGAEPGLKY